MQSDFSRASARGRRALVAVAPVSGAAFVGLAVVIAAGPLALDLSVADALAPLRSGPIGVLVAAFNLVGQALIWDPLVFALAVLLWWRGSRVEAILLVGGVIGAEVGASVAKLLVNRARPPGVAVVDLITQASYPSGHMTRAVVAAGLLAWFAWRRRPSAGLVATVLAIAIALCVFMGVARIAVGEHWFTDVVGASLFGVFALAVIGLLAPTVARMAQRRLPPERRR